MIALVLLLFWGIDVERAGITCLLSVCLDEGMPHLVRALVYRLCDSFC